MTQQYRQCSISVMDTIADPDITFDEKGICNYFYDYKKAEEKFVVKDDAERKRRVESKIAEIKQRQKYQQYDCILGVSGGVDSTYLAYLAKQMGLRVLCVHFDNGWNSELAVKNIENIVSRLGFDLYTYVINWEEFRDIQLSYFKANVVDIEAVTDIAIFSCLDKICSEKKIKYLLDGRNVVTEEVLPPAWICKDPENLVNIHKRFGSIPIRNYPLLSRKRRLYIELNRPFENVKMLNWVEYNKAEAKKTIISELEWRDYGGKHYESVFTRFYQGYILPKKFGIDKRKAHLSNLIFSGQLSKQEALRELEEPIYPETQLKEDYDFVLKKLGFTHEAFEDYLAQPAVPHSAYGFAKPYSEYFPVLKLLKPFRKRKIHNT
jgi:N-acetyl sugar amidotransferase